jgi:hypothetical protein
LRAEGFLCNLDVLYGGLGIGKLQFLIKKKLIFFSAEFFFSQFLVIKALDPDWIRIRIGNQPKMLDPDPDEMNADPQPCLQGVGDAELQASRRRHSRLQVGPRSTPTLILLLLFFLAADDVICLVQHRTAVLRRGRRRRQQAFKSANRLRFSPSQRACNRFFTRLICRVPMRSSVSSITMIGGEGDGSY